MASPTQTRCWCGKLAELEIGPDYRRCAHCGTAVVSAMPARGHFDVRDDGRDFYGKAYWLDYQKERGFPDVAERARTDLSERCLFWLERLLETVRPPGRALEVGCGHGAFVSLLRELGFDAIGMDLSPWVVEFARETFGVSVLRGTLDTLDLAPGFACVAAFDVLEHLADPLDTMRRCARLLAPDGVLLLQTPCYRGEGSDWSMFQKDEHVYLFTKESVRDLLGRAGFNDIQIGSSLFPYDMWIAATPGRLIHHALGEDVAPDGWRLPAAVRALLDLNAQTRALRRSLAEAEADRAERLCRVQELNDLARKIDAERIEQRQSLIAQVEELTRRLQESEADRIARLEVMEELTRRLQESEADRTARLEAMEELTRRLQESEADRTARLEVIRGAEAQVQAQHAEIQALQSRLEQIDSTVISQVYELARKVEADQVVQVEGLTAQVAELTRRLQESEADRAARLEVIRSAEVQGRALRAEIQALQSRLERIERTAVWRVYRTLAREK